MGASSGGAFRSEPPIERTVTTNFINNLITQGTPFIKFDDSQPTKQHSKLTNSDPTNQQTKMPSLLSSTNIYSNKSNILLRILDGTYLSLPINECYEAATSTKVASLQNSTEQNSLKLCFVDWPRVSLLSQNLSNTIPNSIETNNLHLEAFHHHLSQFDGERVYLSDLIQYYPSKFISFFRRNHEQESPYLYNFDPFDITSINANGEVAPSINFQIAKASYLATSSLFSIIGILTNLLILAIIFINTKESYQHYFSCWYCCFWRMLSSGSSGRLGSSVSSNGGSRSGALGVGLPNGGGGGASGNCITGYHYFLLFQMTLTGLLLSSQNLYDDINIYQIDKQVQIISNYENSLPVRNSASRQRGIRHMAELLSANYELFEQQYYKTTADVPWQISTNSPLSIVLPPSPVESKPSFIELERLDRCDGAVNLDGEPLPKGQRRPNTPIASRAQSSLKTNIGQLSFEYESTETDPHSSEVSGLHLENLRMASYSKLVLLVEFAVTNSPSTLSASRTHDGPILLEPEYEVHKSNRAGASLRPKVLSVHVQKLDNQCLAESEGSSKHEHQQTARTVIIGTRLFGLIATVHLWIVASLAYDRFCAIAHPLEYLRSINSSRTRVFLLIIWFVALLFNILVPYTIDRIHAARSNSKTGQEFSVKFDKIRDSGVLRNLSVCLSDVELEASSCDEAWMDTSTKLAVLTADVVSKVHSRAIGLTRKTSDTVHDRKWSDFLNIISLIFAVLNFIVSALTPMLIICACNVSIYGIVKIHERRLSASSSINGNGSLYHARASYLDQQNSINTNCQDRSDTCSIASSIVSKLIRASAQVGLLSATLNNKHQFNVDQQGCDSCYYSYTSDQQNHDQSSPPTANSDLIAFSPCRNYFLEDKTHNHERGDSLRAHYSLTRKDSTVSQACGVVNRATRRLNGNARQLSQDDKIPASEQNATSRPTAFQGRLKRKLSDRNHSSSLATSRRSSFALSECNAHGPTLGYSCHHHSSSGNEFASHNLSGSYSSNKRQDSDGILHQLKMAGLSFAGIAISDRIKQTSDNGQANSNARTSLNRSSSCSLYDLGSQVMVGSNLPVGASGALNLEQRRTNCCGANHCAFGPSSQRAPNASSHSSQCSVNKCVPITAHTEPPSRDSGSLYWPRSKLCVSNTITHQHRGSMTEKYCTRVLDTDSENQFSVGSSHHGATQRDHASQRTHHFSIGTKSRTFNTTVWLVILLLVLTIPCYSIPLISQLMNLIDSDNDRAKSSALNLSNFLSQLIFLRINDHEGERTSTDRLVVDDDETTLEVCLRACFIWLSCLCRISFLAMIPLQAWLYGIRSRSLKTTLRMVLRRYVSQKQATIEINQRRKSNSSLRSRDSSLYCFPNFNPQNHHQNHCSCQQNHQKLQAHMMTQLKQQQKQHKLSLGLAQAQEFPTKNVRRCSSFNLATTPVCSGGGNKEPSAVKTPTSPEGFNGGPDSVPTVERTPHEASVSAAENDDAKQSVSQTKHHSSIRFVIDHSQRPEHPNDQQHSSENSPSPPRGLLNSVGSFLSPNLTRSNNPSASSSRYSSQNSSLNSSLADSNRSLLSASIQSSQSVAFMLLGEQTASSMCTQSPERPKLTGVLKKTSPAVGADLYEEGSQLQEQRAQKSRAEFSPATKCFIEHMGRTKSLDRYQQQTDGYLCKIRRKPIYRPENQRSSILKRFTMNSVDAVTTDIDRNISDEFYSNSPMGDGPDEPIPQVEYLDCGVRIQNSSDATKVGESLRKMSSDITFLLTSVDQSETTKLDLGAESEHPTELFNANDETKIAQSTPLIPKSDSIDSKLSIGQVDETTEMLPHLADDNEARRDLFEQVNNSLDGDNVSRATNGTETSSLHRARESTISQIRDIVARYLSNIRCKASKTVSNSHSLARRSYSATCSHRQIEANYNNCDTGVSLFRKYSDSSASTSSTIASSSCYADSSNTRRKSSFDSGTNKGALGQQQQQKQRQPSQHGCHRSKTMLAMRKSSPSVACEHSMDIKRCNLSTLSRSGLNGYVSSSPSGASGDHDCSEVQGCSNHHHQLDHHHLKPPNCLNLIFDPDSHPPIYASTLALSPIRECSSNHSCASSQSSLNNASSANSTHQANSIQDMKMIETEPSNGSNQIINNHGKNLNIDNLQLPDDSILRYCDAGASDSHTQKGTFPSNC